MHVYYIENCTNVFSLKFVKFSVYTQCRSVNLKYSTYTICLHVYLCPVRYCCLNNTSRRTRYFGSVLNTSADDHRFVSVGH